MSYSCSDFTDTILDALGIDVPEEDYDNPSAQADLALAEIERLRAAVPSPRTWKDMKVVLDVALGAIEAGHTASDPGAVDRIAKMLEG
jgi:hypothetical protein